MKTYEREAKLRNMSVKRYRKETEDCRMACEHMADIDANILLLNEADGQQRERRLANQRSVLKQGSMEWLTEFRLAGWIDPTIQKVLPGLP
jgi:hypothetical protein